MGLWPNVGATPEYAETSGQSIGWSGDLAKMLLAFDGDAWTSLLPNAAGAAVQFNRTSGQGNGGGTAEAAIRGVLVSIMNWPAGNLLP